jgi:arsenite methyltransferase
MALTDEAYAKACCADLYQSPWARQILGDPLHPGGLALTNRLGRLMDIARDDWVADLASARGTSAMAISRVFHCRVVGVEFGAEPVAEAHAIATDQSEGTGTSRSHFLRGDAESTPLATGRFDGVICECSMSLFADKPAAVAEAVRSLRPGGRLGLGDFAVTPGSLPEELRGTIGQILCLAQALDVNGYAQLIQTAGLKLTHQEDASYHVLKILDDVDAKLAALPVLQQFSSGMVSSVFGLPDGGPNDNDMLQQAPRLIARIRELVAAGDLGYWLFVGEKPA